MWFNHLSIYRFELKNEHAFEQLEEDALKPCPPHARFIYGWSPVSQAHFVHQVAGSALICLGKEERLLPRSVIQRLLAERVEALENQRGYPVKRAERSQMAEDLEFELLPKSFCVQKKLPAIFDEINQHLIINTASANQASQLIAQLRRSFPGILIEPLAFEHLSERFSSWINHPQTLPSSFQLGSDCLLFSPDDENKKFNCKGYELPADEILTLLSQGLSPSEITLIWNERIQFTLTHDLILKRMKCLDYLVDDFHALNELSEDERLDAALTLLSGELRSMIDALLKGLASDHSSKVHDTTSSLAMSE